MGALRRFTALVEHVRATEHCREVLFRITDGGSEELIIDDDDGEDIVDRFPMLREHQWWTVPDSS
jgi:hypothetical protein